MSRLHFAPTEEQKRILEHEGSAFVTACPGAGKTRVLAERVRLLLAERRSAKGVACLSFTNAAIFELEQRLRRDGVLPNPAFPHFVGTFDSFLWKFLVAPFGVPGCETPPRLVPDKGEILVRPSEKQRGLPLKCFGLASGDLIPAEARRCGFDLSTNPGLARSYVTAARSLRYRLVQRGQLDFEDARALAMRRLEDSCFSARLGAALAARFREVIVDEAHDCNPVDLDIIQWLRNAAIVTKVICDPHQSIYAFRGGVTEELIAFGATFAKQDQLAMHGNFRSSDPICKAIVALKPVAARALPDVALGDYRAVATPVHILSYSGTGVPSSVGAKFCELVRAHGLDPSHCPVLAATRNSGANAVGQPSESTTKDLILRLAVAVTNFHFDFESGNRKAALQEVHRVVLSIEGRLDSQTYHQFLGAEGIEPGAWRPKILKLVRELRYDPEVYPNSDAWHFRAKELLAPFLPDNGPSISQRLRSNRRLVDVLATAPVSMPPAKTIHAVKGMEFPAVCVVMTAATSKRIVDYLQAGSPTDQAEEARKLYVAASRAQCFLAIAIPRSQAARLKVHLASTSAKVVVVDL